MLQTQIMLNIALFYLSKLEPSYLATKNSTTKMYRYTIDQRIKIVKIRYKNRKNVSKTVRKIRAFSW